MYAEIIYETGNHSIAYYENEEEAKEGVGAHHKRALNGERALKDNPDSGPAERVVKVLTYDKHPADFNESQALPVEEVRKGIEAAIEQLAVGDLVSVPELDSAVRALSSPIVESEPHSSNYKDKEAGELTGWQ